MLRYGLSSAISAQQRARTAPALLADAATTPTFPLGTLAVNVAGCLAAGALARVGSEHFAAWPHTRAFFVVGLLGGFTTFSAFGLETLELWRCASRAMAAANLCAHFALGLGAVALGHWLAGLR